MNQKISDQVRIEKIMLRLSLAHVSTSQYDFDQPDWSA